MIVAAMMLLPLMPNVASASEDGQTNTAEKTQVAVPVEVAVSSGVVVRVAKVASLPIRIVKAVRTKKPARKVAKAVLKLPRRVARRLSRRGG